MEAAGSTTKPRVGRETANSSRFPKGLPRASGSRISFKERVNSAPLGIPHVQERQQRRRSEYQTAEMLQRGIQTPEGSTGSPFTSTSTVDPRSRRLSDPRKAVISRDVQEVALAVIGASGVGKSSFCTSALDLKRAPSSSVASKKVSLEGKISVVRLVEVTLENLEIEEEGMVSWPKEIGNQTIPDIDGVLALYDVMDQDSIKSLPSLLQALSKAALPTVLVSTKCDNPPRSWEVDQEEIQSLCSTFHRLEMFQTSVSASDTHKRCISVILRNIMIRRRVGSTDNDQIDRAAYLRAPANTQEAAAKNASDMNERKVRHTRSVSEALVYTSRSAREPESILPTFKSALTGHNSSGRLNRYCRDLNGHPTRQRSPQRSQLSDDCDKKTFPEGENNVRPESEGSEQSPARTSRPHYPSPSDLSNTGVEVSLNRQDEPEEANNAIDVESMVGGNSVYEDNEQSHESGVSFDQLVERLLSEPKSTSDAKFTTIFLCLYRKFAAPSTLVLAIIRHFEELNNQDLPNLIRMTSQLRYLNIIKEWVSDFPGDFAHPLSRRIVTGFIQNLATSQDYLVASKEISPHLEVVSEDDDTEWACSDKIRSRASTMESFLTMSSASAGSTLNADSPTLTADSSTEDVLEYDVTEDSTPSKAKRFSATPSLTSSVSRSNSQSSSSFQTLLNTVESAQRQAHLLDPIPRNILTKVQWHQFMEITEDQIARELTRIDWIMYSSIRPRDLVRHVSLQSQQKEKCKSLEHVNRMIHHFNHVAFWVTNLILLRDKPKHRAKALEKFMLVAWKLRYLNNYNSLGAVIAGINGTAVHRLSQTRELIPIEAQKQFMRLEILMGTQKGHFAYRLAFSNTTSSRIPFLPLHRRDLVLAEQGNRTYVDSGEDKRINWKKFEIMGEIIDSIRRSQSIGYPNINRNEEVQRLLLEGRFCKDDDILYERSIQIEAPGIGESIKKRFNWFQR